MLVRLGPSSFQCWKGSWPAPLGWPFVTQVLPDSGQYPVCEESLPEGVPGRLRAE